jgi:hypothetical protein
MNDYLQECDALIGDPTVVIEPGTMVLERRGGEFRQVERPSFVKISTGFKAEMKDIDEIALKVWLFIALSVNRNTGRANPGLRTIAEQTGFAVNTVQAAIKRLETKYTLLKVDRASRKFNIYEPVAFVSANKAEPVSPADTVDNTICITQDDTVQKSVSVGTQSVSVDGESVSARVILNQRNQRNQSGTHDDSVSASPLSQAFVNATHIPELTGGAPKWCKALQELTKAGVEPIDITTAVFELRNKGYSIVNLGSIVNSAISAMSKRKGAKEKDQYAPQLQPIIIPAGWTA